jgi:uncharacterized protein (DUF2141 family)
MIRLQTLIAAAVLTLSAASWAVPAAPVSTTLELSFVEIAAPTGRIMLAIFASEADYNAERLVRGAAVDVAATEASTRIEGLAPGTYAIKLFHDVNGNGKMDTNPFGMPIEPFAFSNSAKGHMGPATWGAAMFEVKPGTTSHTISFK